MSVGGVGNPGGAQNINPDIGSDVSVTTNPDAIEWTPGTGFNYTMSGLMSALNTLEVALESAEGCVFILLDAMDK